MRFRTRDSSGRFEPKHLTSMIDVVFLLLIFFMLTLQVLPAEGDLKMDMPRVSDRGDDLPFDEIRVRLTANPDGSLAGIQLGMTQLGTGDAVFDRLRSSVERLAARAPLAEVTIDADYALDYRHVVHALSACTGRLDPATGQTVRFTQKVKFAPPRTRRESQQNP